jgi:hypothetical protein
MAKEQAAAAKRKRAKIKVPKKLYKTLKKEAKKKGVSVSKLALAISERGIRKGKKSKT